MQYANMTTPASFGVEWQVEDRRYQLVNIRGTRSLMFGVTFGSDKWYTVPVVEPERFGLTKPPRSYKAFLEIARAYVETHPSDCQYCQAGEPMEHNYEPA